MNTLLSGQLVSLLTLFMGGGVGVALVAAWTNRRLNAASVEEKRVATADKITSQAAEQFSRALLRIEKLEAKVEQQDMQLEEARITERRLWNRITTLEMVLRAKGIPVPAPDPD